MKIKRKRKKVENIGKIIKKIAEKQKEKLADFYLQINQKKIAKNWQKFKEGTEQQREQNVEEWKKNCEKLLKKFPNEEKFGKIKQKMVEKLKEKIDGETEKKIVENCWEMKKIFVKSEKN